MPDETLPAPRQLTDHRTDVDCVNDRITLFASDPGGGRVPWQYAVVGSDALTDELAFAHAAGVVTVPGLTNEALLAVVLDRLRCAQVGPLRCHENFLAAAKLAEALDVLKSRTVRRAREGVEGTARPGGENDLGRLFVRGDLLHLGPLVLTLASLREAWKAWDAVAAALKGFSPPPTPAEWGVLDAVATTPASKRGLAEIRQHLARTGPA